MKRVAQAVAMRHSRVDATSEPEELMVEGRAGAPDGAHRRNGDIGRVQVSRRVWSQREIRILHAAPPSLPFARGAAGAT